MLLLSMTNGFLSVPNGNRGIGATLPVTMYSALFIIVAWDWLQLRAPEYAPRVLQGSVAAVLLGVAFLTFSSYLGPDRRDQWGFYPETTRVGRYMEGIAPDYTIYAAAGNWPRDALTYLSYQGQPDPFSRVYTYFTEARDLLSQPPSPDKGTAFIVEAAGQNATILQALGQRFPTATMDQIFYDFRGQERLVANVLLVPPGSQPQPFDLPVPTGPQVSAGDQQRRDDLEAIAEALQEYNDRFGVYPTTGGNLQTACVFPDLDALCQVAARVGPERLKDPRGDAVAYGYWYSSDGATYRLYATLESAVSPDEVCRTNDASLRLKPNLYCIGGTSD
jgi:hypothetical protein